MMKEIIAERLQKMEDLEQRRALKNILSGLMVNLIDYQEKANLELENRVFSEIEDEESKYDLYTMICQKKELDPFESFLYPVFNDNFLRSIKDVTTKLKFNEEVILDRIFMECDYQTLQKLLCSERVYQGRIRSTKGSCPATFSLKQNTQFQTEIAALYEIFQKNNQPWRTINSPYANRFFDLVLVKGEGIEKLDEIFAVEVDLEEYEVYKRTEMIPLWNLERLNFKSVGFPIPSLDKVNYEHKISLVRSGVEHGYLLTSNEPVSYLMRTAEELVLGTPKDRIDEWNLLKVTQNKPDEQHNYRYEIFSNARKKNFINKFAQKHQPALRTKGEIRRIVNSFETSKYFEFSDLEILGVKNTQTLTYDCNYFITDDIRVGNDKKILKLNFTSKLSNSFCVNDLLSFLVSELQMYFPDYLCVGELL